MDAEETVLEVAFREGLFADIPDKKDFPDQRPLLAHYTSIETFEKILKGEEVWFSNPLLMNDWQEVRWGILEGTRLAMTDERIRGACGTSERANLLANLIEQYRTRFDGQHALNTYIFCLCMHGADDYDGLLSMWRGYGNQAGGIAIVLDTAKFSGEPIGRLMLARVHYASDDERKLWLTDLFGKFATILQDRGPADDQLYVAAWTLFERLKLFAIFSKHHGFREEQEWRAAYLPWWDEEKAFEKYFSYQITASGVQPKLMLPIKEIPLEDGSECIFEKVINRIILGPTVSSPLAKASLDRMLDCLGFAELKPRVHASGIPFRAV